MHVCACPHRLTCPSAPVKLHAAPLCFIKGVLIWSLLYYFQWFAASRAAENWKEQGSLLSPRCSLPLKGHVVFSGNWLNGFGFCDTRSGRFHSAWVSWGTFSHWPHYPALVMSLAQTGCGPGLVCPCEPALLLGPVWVDVGASPSVWSLHLSQQRLPLSHWEKITEVGTGYGGARDHLFLLREAQGMERQRGDARPVFRCKSLLFSA